MSGFFSGFLLFLVRRHPFLRMRVQQAEHQFHFVIVHQPISITPPIKELSRQQLHWCQDEFGEFDLGNRAFSQILINDVHQLAAELIFAAGPV